MNLHDFPDMDSFDHEEMSAIFGEDFEDYFSSQHSFSSPENINILSSSSITSHHNFPSFTPLIDYHQNKLPTTHGLIIDDHERSVLDFGYHEINHTENLQQVNALPAPCYDVKGNSDTSQTLKSRGSKNTSKAKQIPKKKKTRTRPPAQVYEHIMAERRRREQLSQLFIALSAIVPGLKKTDKTSILGEAINYLKHLEQRAENLEEAKRSSKMAMESGVFVKKSQVFEEEEGSSLAGEIEVRVVNNNVLIRVHCGKHKGILANLLSQVESMNMVVVNTNVSLFGNSSLEITIIAEMEKGFSLSVKEVATALRGAFKPATA
ncbi:Transcription factor bHLH19 [Striga hermonthica]|uniref:Transcription factor bHLH19 n=1 Tax=Striga hermonthica TaxID=68872 RepID=A0A9N7RPV1_STRHE|nr:Transcription factor bHLH19 [Striga hermonthica]